MFPSLFYLIRTSNFGSSYFLPQFIDEETEVWEYISFKFPQLRSGRSRLLRAMTSLLFPGRAGLQVKGLDGRP